MGAADGVCAFAPPGADPTDALTIAWKYTSGCSGSCNFGVALVTDFLNEDNEVESKEIKVHRGIALINLIEHKDPRLTWSASHPEYAAKKGTTMFHEWSVTPVDIDGKVGENTNLCKADLETVSGGVRGS